MNDHGKMELRSEKVRNVIGKVPPSLIRNGITIVFVVILLLLIGAYFIHYPDNVNIRLKIISENSLNKTFQGEGLIPYQYITNINEGMKVIIELEGYIKSEYGLIEGIICVKENKIEEYAGQSYFPIKVSIPENSHILIGMYGNGKILVSEKTILEHLLNKTAK
jgi:hypothetical protein